MGLAFDPYYKWLGIPREDQPPNHYRLLGLTDFEGDPDVIQAAADQRMAHLRTYQTGQYSSFSQRLLNEVSAARICLLTPVKKLEYDAQLRQSQGRKRPAAPSVVVSPPLPPPPVSNGSFPIIVDDLKPLRPSAALSGSRRRTPLGGVIAGAVAMFSVLVIGLAYVMTKPSAVIAKGNGQSADSAIQPAPNDPIERQGATTSKDCSDKGSKPSTPKTPTDATGTHSTKPKKPELVVKQPSLTLLDPPRPHDIAVPENTIDPSADLPPNHAVDPHRKADHPSDFVSNETEPELVDRAAAPDAATQEEAMRLAAELYKEDFAKAKSPEEKDALARRLLVQARNTGGDDAGAFVLMQLARDTSAQAGNAEIAMAAIDAIAERYRIDTLGLKVETLGLCSKKSRTPEQHLAAAHQGAQLLDEAVASADYEQAVDLAKLVAAEAALGRNKELVQWAKTELSQISSRSCGEI